MLQNLQAQVVKAGINEVHFLVGVGLAQAVGQLEKGLTFFRILKNEGGGLENGELDGLFALGGRVAVAHHQIFGR